MCYINLRFTYLLTYLLFPISLSLLTVKLFVCCIVYVLIAQLAEIRKFTYAKVLCENADYMPRIQPNVFLHPYSVVQHIVRYVR